MLEHSTHCELQLLPPHICHVISNGGMGLKQPNLACCSLSSPGLQRRTCVPPPGLHYAATRAPTFAMAVAPWPVRCNALQQPALLIVCDYYFQLTADLMRQTLWEAHRCSRLPGATHYKAVQQLMSHETGMPSSMSCSWAPTAEYLPGTQ